MKRGEISEAERNPPLGLKSSMVCDQQYGREGFRCPKCGTFTTLRGGRVKPHLKKIVKKMVEEKFCQRCRAYADGRRTECSRLPNGPGTTCKAVWPSIPSAWCAGCKV